MPFYFFQVFIKCINSCRVFICVIFFQGYVHEKSTGNDELQNSSQKYCRQSWTSPSFHNGLVFVPADVFAIVLTSLQWPLFTTIACESSQVSPWFLRAKLWLANNVLRNRNCLVAWILRQYFSGGERWRPEICLCLQPTSTTTTDIYVCP